MPIPIAYNLVTYNPNPELLETKLLNNLKDALIILRNLGGTVPNYSEPQSASILGLFYLEIIISVRLCL